MLIYGVSGIFSHKKTIKQFLQLMIEQVWGGGGWMCRDVPNPRHDFIGSFSYFLLKRVLKYPNV